MITFIAMYLLLGLVSTVSALGVLYTEKEGIKYVTDTNYRDMAIIGVASWPVMMTCIMLDVIRIYKKRNSDR